jgi:TP901 family phage tail tape measure protein
VANRTVSVALRAEIGQYMAGMTQAAAATKGLGETADASAKRTRSGFDLASKGALLMGGAVVAGIGMAVSKSMEFEKSMSAVGAASQATTGTLADLREAAMKAGADTQYSATEAADAITEMSKAGVSAADIMGGGLAGSLDLAAAGQLDVAKAAGIASVAMTQFNLSGEDLPHVADLLAAGAGKAMGSVEDLGMALNQSGLIAAAAGLSIEETTGGLAAFASAGLIGSDAGTSFKVMLQALQAPSSTASKVMEQYGINMYDANGNMLGLSDMAGVLQQRLGGLTDEQRNSALATIFGTDAVRAANVLYKEGASGITDWTMKVNDAGYAQEQAAALTDNLSGDLERLGGAFDTLMIELGSGAQGPLREVVQALTGVLDIATGAIDVFRAIPVPVLTGVAAFAAVAALKGPVGSALETVALRAMYARDAVGRASISMDGLNKSAGGVVSMLGGPWGIGLAAGAVMVTSFASDLSQASDETDRWAQALLDGGNAAEKARNQYADEDYFLRALDEWTGLASSMEDAGKKAKELYDAMSPLEQKQQDVTRTSNDLEWAVGKYGATSAQAKDAALAHAAAEDTLTKAQGQVKQATDAASATMEVAAGKTRDFKEEASEAKKAVDALKAGLDALTGTTVSMFQAESALQEAVEEGTGALEGMTGAVLDANGKLNVYSESGRQAGAVLLDVRDKGNELIAMMVNQGDSADVVKRKEDELRRAFIATAGQMGITGRDAERLADQILGIPAERYTRVTADTTQARRDVEAFIGAVTGKSIVMTGNFQPGAGVVVRRAQGGVVQGPGTGTSDSIPALISNGEYVVNAAATARNRDWLDAINSGMVAKFAKGGIADNYSIPVSVAGFPDPSRIMPAPEPGGGGSARGLLPIMAAAREYVSALYGIRNIGGFSNRNIAGTNVKSDHALGKAIDVMTSNRSLGWAVANDLAFGAAHRRFNIENVIWQQSISSRGGPFKRMADRGSITQNHYDHIHADTYDQGGPLLPGYTLAYNGTGKTEWVSKEMPGSAGGGGGGAAPAPNLTGLTISGQLSFDASGVATIAGTVVEARLEDMYRQQVRR